MNILYDKIKEYLPYGCNYITEWYYDRIGYLIIYPPPDLYISEEAYDLLETCSIESIYEAVDFLMSQEGLFKNIGDAADRGHRKVLETRYSGIKNRKERQEKIDQDMADSKEYVRKHKKLYTITGGIAGGIGGAALGAVGGPVGMAAGAATGAATGAAIGSGVGRGTGWAMGKGSKVIGDAALGPNKNYNTAHRGAVGSLGLSVTGVGLLNALPAYWIGKSVEKDKIRKWAKEHNVSYKEAVAALNKANQIAASKGKR